MFIVNTNSIRKIKNLFAMDKCCHKCEKGGIFPPKYFTIFDGFMAFANTLFYIYDGRMFVASVNSFDGFTSVVVNNTLFYIYNRRMFVANNNTIKNIYFVFSTYKSCHKC